MPPPASSLSSIKRDSASVQDLFARISRKYDLMNRVLSGGIDIHWRACAARRIASRNPTCVLDLACGSGDLWLALRKRLPNAKLVGADFCQPLLDRAAQKGCAPLILADALALPFDTGSFDAVAIAFGFRNMEDYPRAAAECARVLRRGGELHILDFSMPGNAAVRVIYRFYLHRVLPRLAGWLTGEQNAYQYLGGSIEQFPSGPAMEQLLLSAGFREATTRPMTFGITSHYIARR